MRVLGLMSGTSLDGIDAAILETDGVEIGALGAHLFRPYAAPMRSLLQKAVEAGKNCLPALQKKAEAMITEAHGSAVQALCARLDKREMPSLIGFHGQTLWHSPESGETCQIGDCALLARQSGMDVVGDFRVNDMAHGGEGAPLAPLYHQALARASDLPFPLVVLNIGGVANLTWIGSGEDESTLLAFDTGTGMALLNDWVMRHEKRPYDEEGALGAKGKADQTILKTFMQSPYFSRPPPKSLDRGHFSLNPLQGLGAADGAATLTHLTLEGILAARRHLPAEPKLWVLTGGGRRNRFLLSCLKQSLRQELRTAEEVGWQGDMIEAQAFAYLAARSVCDLPLSLPKTTGVPLPLTGGTLYKFSDRNASLS